MIVVDVNVIAYFLMPGAQSAAAESVYQRDSRWIAPELWKSEMMNLLATQLRLKMLSLERAIQITDDASEMLTPMDAVVPVSRILDLSVTSGCSAYDCEYVAMAQHFRVPLVTADRKVLHAFPQTAIAMSSFSNPSA